MKYFRALVIIVGSLLFVSSSVFAQTTTTPVLTDVGEYNGDALVARVAELRQQYKVNLTENEKTRISQRCEKAQDSLRAILERTNTIREARTTTYSGVVGALINMRGLLAVKQIDSSNVEILIVDYQQKSRLFEVAIDAYELRLQDAITIDCENQQEDFIATIEGVRAQRKEVVSVSDQIEELTKSNLNTAFSTVKNRLLDNEEEVNGN